MLVLSSWPLRFNRGCVLARNSRVRAAAFFAGVARQLHPINGKQLAPDQALCITSYQHLAKQGLNLIAQAANKLGNVGVAGLAVAADGDELNIAQAGLLYAAA